MSKKTSNVKLLIILVILLGAIGVVKLMDSKQGERNFRSELVEIDTSKVTAIHIYPKSLPGEVVRLSVESDKWKIKVNEKSVSTEKSMVPRILNELIGLKPKRLAGKTAERWKDFQVDSLATRVEVYEGDKKTLDLVVGKFSFQQNSNNMETFVRLAAEEETYTVDGFLDPTFNNGTDHWRDKTIIKGDKGEWISLSFTLPALGSYQLQMQDSVWKIGGEVADATEVDNYLNALSQVSGASYADDIEESALGTPDYMLEIANKQGDKIKVDGFVKDEKQILRSSLNPESLFNVEAGAANLFETIFVDTSKFFPEEEEEITYVIN